MEPKGSPPRPQEPLKQINPADKLPINFKLYFNIIFHLRLTLPKSAVYQVLLGPISELKSEARY